MEAGKPVSGPSAQLGSHPLRRDDARGEEMLVAGYSAELATQPAMSVAQTEQLFATPWLKGDAGRVLGCDSETAGYLFARSTRPKRSDSIQIGLTPRRGHRNHTTNRVLADRLSRFFVRDTVLTPIPKPRRR